MKVQSLTLSALLVTILSSPFSSPASATPLAIPADAVRAAELFSVSDAEIANLLTVKNHKGEIVLSAKKHANHASEIWATKDAVKNGIQGTSTDRAYRKHFLRMLFEREDRPVVVAVIDGGVDISHEDLQGKIWVNEKELNGKPGIDDDGNGYVDDAYGWNFLGAKDGRNVGEQTLEVTREYARLKKKKESTGLSPEEQKYFEAVAIDFNKKKGVSAARASEFRDMLEKMEAALVILRGAGLKEESVPAVLAIDSKDPAVVAAKDFALKMLLDKLSTSYLRRALAYYEAKKDKDAKFYFNTEFNSSTIVGDDPDNMEETGYGNSDVTGPDASHGTHVSGIIAAIRGNRFGVKGQAKNVRIMAIRAVPDGDERDKDVANAIRYAVDNGARIINMSFGKDYSPNKSTVDSACRYAESRGVLLVHAAGNDGKNTESGSNNFPNKRTLQLGAEPGRTLENWIEVGASGPKRDENLPAEFSNYGKTSVDLFAPGVEIISTTPGNQYAAYDGTSMASPEVAGVAALLLSQKGGLEAKSLRAILMETSTKYEGLMVKLPGSKTETAPFSSLSVAGGIVNAMRALNLVY
ncbi:MAG: S8 family peptidase [Deltaproteobacteria bacterium]|nr:S8 family peptidase [Deltaproteobacteria bacterium]